MIWNKENELLKMDINYLSAKRKLITHKHNEFYEEKDTSRVNQTLDISDDYILTMVEDRMSMSFNDLNDISNIKHEKDVNSKSLGEDEFAKAIVEIKEEDIEESDKSLSDRSDDLLTNESTFNISQVSLNW